MNREVTKEVTRYQCYLYVLGVSRDPEAAKERFSRLKINKQSIYRARKVLKKLGVINKIGYGTWQISQDFEKKSDQEILRFIEDKSCGTKRSNTESSVGARNHANLHALNINIPVLEGKVDLKGGYEAKLNNWNQQFKRFPKLGVTLQNNNNKSLNVFVWSREIFDYLAVPALCHAAVHTVCSLFKSEGVVLDYFGWRVTTLHLMIRNEDLDKVLNKGLKIEVALGRAVEKVSERDVTKEAKAWADSSPYKGIETNDVAYYRNHILMPENVAKMAAGMDKFLSEFLPVFQEFSRDVAVHNAVLKKIDKSFSRFNRLLSQRSLNEFVR